MERSAYRPWADWVSPARAAPMHRSAANSASAARTSIGGRMRDFTWSSTEDLFYGADETGLYRVTPEGDSTFVAGPVGGAQYKGITFFNVNDGAGCWYRIVTAGSFELLIRRPAIKSAERSSFWIPSPPSPKSPLLSLVEHPNGNELWGIGRGANVFSRTLIRIDPLTGETDLLAQLSVHMADLAWVFPVGPVIHTWNVNADGDLVCSRQLDEWSA